MKKKCQTFHLNFDCHKVELNESIQDVIAVAAVLVAVAVVYTSIKINAFVLNAVMKSDS